MTIINNFFPYTSPVPFIPLSFPSSWSEHRTTSRERLAPMSSHEAAQPTLIRTTSAPPPDPSSAAHPATSSLQGMARSPPGAYSHLPTRPSPLGSGLPGRSLSGGQDGGMGLRLTSGKSVPGGTATPGSTAGSGRKGKVLGMQERLRREVDGVVKRRSGGVLGRG